MTSVNRSTKNSLPNLDIHLWGYTEEGTLHFKCIVGPDFLTQFYRDNSIYNYRQNEEKHETYI